MLEMKLYNYVDDTQPRTVYINPKAVSFMADIPGITEDEDPRYMEINLNGLFGYVKIKDAKKILAAADDQKCKDPETIEPEIFNNTLIADSADTHRSLDTVDKALDTINSVLTAGRTVNGK